MGITGEDLHDHVCIDRILGDRRVYLDMLRREAEKRLKSAPQGSLRISSSYGRTQYYHRQTSSDRKGTYLPVSKRNLAGQLAQKGYEEQVLKAALEEIHAITAYETLAPQMRSGGTDDRDG